MSLTERMRKLVATWRDPRKHNKLDDPIFEFCADELEKLYLFESDDEIQSIEQLKLAVKLTISHFKRNQVSGNFQGDDEHECWTALQRGLALVERKT